AAPARPPAAQRLRRLQMLVQRGQRLLGVSAGGIVLLCFFFVLFNVLLVVRDHLLRKRAVEAVAGEFGHFLVHCLLFAVRLGRWGHAHLIGCGSGLLVGVGMILLQHLAERANAVTLGVFLGQLAHLNFRQIALDRLFEEFLAPF